MNKLTADMNRIKFIMLVSVVCILSTSCANYAKPRIDSNLNNYTDPKPEEANNEKEFDIRSSIQQILQAFHQDKAYTIDEELLDRVNNYIYAFTQGGLKDFFINSLCRGDRYINSISTMLDKHNMPSELVYLALIESGNQPTIKSKKNALGLWQFRKGTAIDYNLIDRTDVKQSTIAAMKYINDLLCMFDDPLIALSAYNCGEGRVMYALKQLPHHSQRSFSSLMKENLIPKETQDYIPKFLAAVICGTHREKFNLTCSSFIQEEEIIRPEKLYVKRVESKQIEQKISKNEYHHSKKSKAKDSKQIYHYTIRKGDTLSRISTLFGVSINEITTTNKISVRDVLDKGKILRIPLKNKPKEFEIVIKKGETPSSIAKKYKTKPNFVFSKYDDMLIAGKEAVVLRFIE
ncbi:MAG: transglycosylase SLT domain-containing protein [Desulfobacterales bacterium]|nr:transglycosylase SLT domain-containing protein [Desulfobacterales bacterium]